MWSCLYICIQYRIYFFYSTNIYFTVQNLLLLERERISMMYFHVDCILFTYYTSMIYSILGHFFRFPHGLPFSVSAGSVPSGCRSPAAGVSQTAPCFPRSPPSPQQTQTHAPTPQGLTQDLTQDLPAFLTQEFTRQAAQGG